MNKNSIKYPLNNIDLSSTKFGRALLKLFDRKDELIVFHSELHDIFLKQFGQRTFEETGEKIKIKLFDVAEQLFKLEKEYGLQYEFLGAYVYYLENDFFKLWENYLKNKKKNTDTYQRLQSKEGWDPFLYFLKYGFFCKVFMSMEMQKAIFDEGRYNLFWDELTHFWDEWKYEKEKRKVKGELLESSSGFLMRREGREKPLGRPLIVTREMLLEFADRLEENRKRKKWTLNEILKSIAKDKIHPTTIRNWLRNHMPFLQGEKRSIGDLTKDDILTMWKKSKELKLRQ